MGLPCHGKDCITRRKLLKTSLNPMVNSRSNSSSFQESEVAHENGSSARGRPVLEAKLQVSTPESARSSASAPMMPGSGVTASLGMGRPAGNNPSDKSLHGPPHLHGLPANAQSSGVARLVGVSSSIVSRPRKESAEEQFHKHLAHRAAEHDVEKLQAATRGGKIQN